MAEVVDSDEEEEDMFIQGGGATAAVSFYSAELDEDDDDKDLDEDSDGETPVPVQPRGPRSRLNRDLRPKSREKVIEIPDEAPSEAPAVEKKSVFDNNSDDDVIDVFDHVEVDVEGQQAHMRALALIEEANQLISTKGDERQIEMDAEEYAKRASAEAAKRDGSRERMARMNPERSAGTKPPHLPHPSLSGGTTSPGSAGHANGNGVSATAGAADGGGVPITLRVRHGDNSIKMKILTTDPLRKMLAPFCGRFNIDASKAVMEVDGEIVEEVDTAATYDLENNNLIEIRVRK